MSESFEFVVGYSTTFEQLEDLRRKLAFICDVGSNTDSPCLVDRMLKFLEIERRDYMPVFDVLVQDIPEQSTMKLQASIKYKSVGPLFLILQYLTMLILIIIMCFQNWQQGALKAQRRNKWICALKQALREAKVFGPSGDPDAPAAGPQKVQLIPYEEEHQSPSAPAPAFPDANTRTNFNLTDSHNAMLSQGTGNIFGDESEVRMPVPTTGSSNNSGSTLNDSDVRPGLRGAGSAQQDAVLRSRTQAQLQPQPPQPVRWASAEDIEMQATAPRH